MTSPAGLGGARVGCVLQAGVARVTLCHPGKFNAMSRAMWRQLRTVFEQIAATESLRCVHLSGADGHFCAGGDISEYPDFRFQINELHDFHENEVWAGLSAMLACDVPIVAQIAGNCMGAGLEIASCCDLRLAGASARLGAPIARLGFPMAPREAQLLVREVGWATVREMLLQAAVLDAAEMKARGFLHAVYGDAELLEQAQARVQQLLTLAPQAARRNKRSLRALAAATCVESTPLDAYDYADSAEQREGIAAFLSKRRARF
ncbi:enoyl-CoA hydratase/isomerase family protein [Hydrogenophaga sp.]|uniref:enoyl-CoA hydratase/isomerase family protein n=1 Tax=Hydrogenophaga sp. TaxID=1904254 RepID=UPI0025C54616|nr:enoyl-CoA hydratase/isomerase family protein [Hydrogenophaga sp.]